MLCIKIVVPVISHSIWKTIVKPVFKKNEQFNFNAFIIFRMYDQQYLVKKLHEVEGIDNPNLADKNGSLNSLAKPEDTKEV